MIDKFERFNISKVDENSKKQIELYFTINEKYIESDNVEKIALFIGEILSLRDFLNNVETANDQILDEAEIFAGLDNFFKKAELFEAEISSSLLIARTKVLFRELISSVFNRSDLTRYSTQKPKGYPGDYKIIERIYSNSFEHKGQGVGHLIDKYLLQNIYAEAIRYRKNKTKEIIKQFVGENQNKNINILNLASGSCREIRELLDERYSLGKALNFTLVDQDLDSLEFSKSQISTYSAEVTKKYQFQFVQSDVIAYLKNNLSLQLTKSFDFSYCIGLADYLPDSILLSLIKYTIQSLAAEGVFVLAHKNTKKYKFTISDWSADWKFIPRDLDDLKKIINIVADERKINWEYVGDESLPVFFMKFQKA